MKKILSGFKESAAELKNVRCLTVTGIMVAVFILLDMCSIRVGDFIKVNFNFTAIAVVGMLFGPVPAVLASIAGDLIGCILSGQAPIIPLSLTSMLEGLLYGALLYKKSGLKLVIFSITARVIDSAVICLIFNTAILMHFGFMSKTAAQLYMRYGKLSTELVFFIPLIIFLLPAVQRLYERNFRHKTRL